MGTTDTDGEVLVPDLASYQDNRLSIADGDIPIDYTPERIRLSVMPRFRSGVLADFGATRFQAFIGVTGFDVDGTIVPADLAFLTYETDGESVETVVGRGGEFYLENISPGTHPARLHNDELDCPFELFIPQSDEVLVDLGEVYCEMD